MSELLLECGIEFSSVNPLNGLDGLGVTRQRWPQLIPLIEKRLEELTNPPEVIEELLPHDVIAWD